MSRVKVGGRDDLARGSMSIQRIVNQFNTLRAEVIRLAGAAHGNELRGTVGARIGVNAARVATNGFQFTRASDDTLVTVPALETAFTATSHDIAPVSSAASEAIYVFSINPASPTVLTVTKGTSATQAAVAAAPATPGGHIKLAELRIRIGASGAFDATTTLLTDPALGILFTDTAGAAEFPRALTGQ